MIVVADTAPVFPVRARHRHEEVGVVRGDDDAGVLVTDRGKRDDAQEREAVKQQKGIRTTTTPANSRAWNGASHPSRPP